MRLLAFPPNCRNASLKVSRLKVLIEFDLESTNVDALQFGKRETPPFLPMSDYETKEDEILSLGFAFCYKPSPVSGGKEEFHVAGRVARALLRVEFGQPCRSSRRVRLGSYAIWSAGHHIRSRFACAFPAFGVPCILNCKARTQYRLDNLSTVAIYKFLRRAEWCVVSFGEAFDKLERVAEFIVHCFGAVTHNVEAAAIPWPIEAK